MSRQPMDSGWAWMICLGTGVQAFFVIGGLKCMGILFVEIIEIFGASRSVTSLTLGLVAGGFAVFSILCNALCTVVGMRVLSLCGGLCLSVALFLSMFPLSISYIVIMLGLITGIALGAMLTPALILLNMYFDKRRSLANGLALAGSSVGQFTLPYLITYLIHEYGYQGAMLIYSAIALHTIPAAMLLRPVAFWHGRKERSETLDNKEYDGINLECAKGIMESASTNSVNTQIQTDSSNRSPHASMKMLPASDLNESSSSALTSTIDVENIEKTKAIYNKEPQTKSWKCFCIRIKCISGRTFCGLIFDKDLIHSPCLWLLFLALGLGHAGFINAILHLPALAMEIFNEKSKGALLVTVVGGFDLCGRVGGGWFSDQGYLSRGTIIITGFTVSGLSTVLLVYYPVLPILLLYCLIMGCLGGLYRILLAVIVGDMFGQKKLGPGLGMLSVSLGLIILPVPPLLGYMREVYGTYLPSIQLCGALMLSGGLLMVIVQYVKKYDTAVIKPNSSPAVIKQERNLDVDS